MEIAKKPFGCKFIILGNEQQGVPAILLELTCLVNKNPEEVAVLLQEKGARELAAALLRESDVFCEFIKEQMQCGEHV